MIDDQIADLEDKTDGTLRFANELAEDMNDLAFSLSALEARLDMLAGKVDLILARLEVDEFDKHIGG